MNYRLTYTDFCKLFAYFCLFVMIVEIQTSAWTTLTQAAATTRFISAVTFG